ncbi:MAG: FeoA family protein [Spirochaetaceae bacterium]|jgi:ferrous iron transport protein A|nr:FeoA family protein [Spirochaetaceae bacterium]
MTLIDKNPHEQCVITGFAPGSKKYRARLLAMGLTRGTRVKLIRRAPMGDPLEIELRGFRLTLRRDEASIVLIQIGRHDGRGPHGFGKKNRGKHCE